MRDWYGLPGDPSPLQVAIKVRGGGASGWGQESRVPRREKQLLMLGSTHPPGVWGPQGLGALILPRLPELCSQDERDFLTAVHLGPQAMWQLWGRHPASAGVASLHHGAKGSKSRDTEVPCSFVEPKAWFLSLLVMGCVYHQPSKFSHQNIVHCVELSFQTGPHLILLELMSGGDMKFPEAQPTTPAKIFLPAPQVPLKTLSTCAKTFMGKCTLSPTQAQPSPLAMQDLLQLAQDIVQGCHYLRKIFLWGHPLDWQVRNHSGSWDPLALFPPRKRPST